MRGSCCGMAPASASVTRRRLKYIESLRPVPGVIWCDTIIGCTFLISFLQSLATSGEGDLGQAVGCPGKKNLGQAWMEE